MAAAAEFLKLTPAEITLFGRLFEQVVDVNGTTASGASVSNLFLTSKLPRPTLAAIWNIASQGKAGKLDRDGFFVGCRLVAIAQQNLPISQESLISCKELPLPIFYGVPQQYYPRDGPNLDGQPPLPIQDLSISSTPQQQSISNVARTPSPPQTRISMASSSDSVKSLNPSTTPDGLWEISNDKRATYLKYFDQADADKDGFVNGKEAKSFFTMSKLSSAVLRDIWLLSDIDQDNRLNREEFTIAMHVTMAVRMAGVPVPSRLPEPLMQYYRRQMSQAHPEQQLQPQRPQQPRQQQQQPQQSQSQQFQLPQQELLQPHQKQQPQQPPQPREIQPQIPRQLQQHLQKQPPPQQQQQQPLQPQQFQPQKSQQLQPQPQEQQQRIQKPFSLPSTGKDGAEPTMAPTSIQTPASFVPKAAGPSPEQLEERAEFARQASSAKTQIEEQKIAIQGYQSRLPDYEEEIEALKAEARKAQETLAALVVKRKQHQASFEKVRGDVASAKVDVENMQKLIASEVESLKRFEAEAKRHVQELDDLHLERDRGQKQVDELKQQVQDKELAIVCLEQEMEDTRKQIGHLTEVSNYQMQIYGKVSNEYDAKELQLAELRTAHRNLAQAPAPKGADSLSAPETPPKLVPLSAPVSNVAPGQEFVFPELTESDFPPGSMTTRTSLKPTAAELEHASSEPFPTPFQFPDGTAQQELFPVSSDAPDFSWNAQQNTSALDDLSAKNYDVNPFEEGGAWGLSPSQPDSEAAPIDASKQGSSSASSGRDDAKTANIDWPIEDFEPAATTTEQWAQF